MHSNIPTINTGKSAYRYGANSSANCTYSTSSQWLTSSNYSSKPYY